MSLNEMQESALKISSKYAKEKLCHRSKEIDSTGNFPLNEINQLFDLGFMSMMVSDKFGGSNMDTISYVLALEQISSACASTGVIMSVNNSLFLSPIEKYGNDDQRRFYIKEFVENKKIGCFALSEPDNGSDAGAAKTTAVLNDNYWILNGTKSWITNGLQASAAIVFASTDRQLKNKGISAFIIPLDSKEIIKGKNEQKLGIKGSSTCSLTFDNLKIDKSALLGQVGQGFKIAMETLDGGRIGIASQALGIAYASLMHAIEYSKKRKAFNKPISDLQAIQFKLADMSCKYESAKLLTLKAAYNKDKRISFSKEAAMAKLVASEASVFNSHQAMQIHGGMGYVKDLPLERFYRDSRITEIYEGTSEIQKLVIASNLLK